MTLTQIEENVNKLLSNLNHEQFIFDFLLSYAEPKATIARLKKGNLNQLNTKGELTHRKKLFFKIVTKYLHSAGMEKAQYINENIADVKAFAKLYDEILKNKEDI
ncbi:MAG: hypothetical protein DSZ11_02070 [Sulfurovum sp.]|nr:MAG: hypothetical protein DSZ11_02070 [Sulfurovum sp.]